MSLATRTSWLIERHLGRPLTLAGLAAACGVSRFHLAHVFGQMTGHSVMTHARERRLSEAAKVLAAGQGRGAPSILDLALDAGYGSHAAFSRAFHDNFGVAPDAVRKAGSLDGLSLTRPVRGGATPPVPSQPEGAPLPMRRETIAEPWVFVGLPQSHAFDALEAIAGQWARFMPRAGEIEAKADPIPWGVARAIEADGRLDYLAAVRVSAATGPVPAGLTRCVVAPARYAVFRHTAHVSQIRATYEAIWAWLPSSDLRVAAAPTLEHHCPTFDPRTGDGGVEIWIAVAA